jgi:iron complex transport system substrate-binding protein
MHRLAPSVALLLACGVLATPADGSGAGAAGRGDVPANGYGAAGVDTLTVTDAAGRQVTLSRPPRRIVTVFSSNTELVAALGLADRIVGIDALTVYPPEILDRPRISGRLGMSVDALIAQQPDLVLLTPARQAMHQLIEPLSRLRVPAIVLMSRSLDEVLANLRLIGDICGVPQHAGELAGRLERRLQAVKRAHVGRVAPSVVMITGTVGNGMVLIARADSYTGDAIVAAGARLALHPPAGLAQVSLEALWRADPEVLLFAGSGEALRELLRQPGWQQLSAVRAGRVHLVSRGEFLIPGPRTVDGVEKLATLLHPAAAPT